jgi:exopolyphosphatase
VLSAPVFAFVPITHNMAVPRNSLRGFLAQARGALRGAIESSQKVTIVIGNESADLDSMTCSILYVLRNMTGDKQRLG